MADSPEEQNANLLHSLPVDNPDDRVDALWRQIMLYKAFTDTTLTDAKARRAEAEAAREKAEQEAAEATRRLCEGMMSEADSKLKETVRIEAEAARVLRQGVEERARATAAMKESEDARERIVAEAKQKAQEIIDRARMAAQLEGTELRRQALGEIKSMMGRIEAVRAATDEELETQRVYSHVAKIKSTSTSLVVEPDHRVQDVAGNHHADQAIGPSQPTQEAASTPDDVPASGESPPEPGKAGGQVQKSAGARGKEKKGNKGQSQKTHW